jgi:hypothetical protein
MKKVASLMFGMSLVVGSAFAQDNAASDNPFIMQGDRAELIRVMATPDRAGIDPSARGVELNAPQSGATYRASYGAGNLLDHGGAVMSNARVFNIFLGTTGAEFGSYLDAMVSTFGNNRADYSIVTQYSKTNNAIGASYAFDGSYNDVAFVGTTMSDLQAQQYLAGKLSSGAVPSTNASSTVYGIYLPPGVVSSMGGSTGCGGTNLGYCGYHNHFTWNGQQVKYAIYPYNNCSGCSLTGKTVRDMQTIVTSHEIREAVTDPGDNNSNAWYDRAGYEADDKCAWHNLYQMSGTTFWVQPEYSNKNKGCVVP